MTKDSRHPNAAGSTEPDSSDAAQEKSTAKRSWDKIERRSRLTSMCNAIRYLSKLNSDELRRSDSWTERLLVATIIAVAVLLFTPAKYLTSMIVFWDLFFGTTLLLFIANRFGSLTLLSPKQAALVRDLLISISLLAIFLIIQLTAVFLTIRNIVRAS